MPQERKKRTQANKKPYKRTITTKNHSAVPDRKKRKRLIALYLHRPSRNGHINAYSDANYWQEAAFAKKIARVSGSQLRQSLGQPARPELLSEDNPMGGREHVSVKK
jgi:hypothetical protein